ncbi:DUF2130 domain-containing protein [bacterium]|nr:DUF2130 domain-containing protein [bacterium]
MNLGHAIKCPKCQYEIPLSEALGNQIQQQIQAELNQRLQDRETQIQAEHDALDARSKELDRQQELVDKMVEAKLKEVTNTISKDARQKAEEEFAQKLEAANDDLKEKKERIKEFQKREIDLSKERERLAEQQAELELEMQRQRDAVRKELESEYQKRQDAAITKAREDAERKVRDEASQQITQAQDELKAQKQQLTKMRDQELTLRKEKQELESAKEQLELDVQRRLDGERKTIAENAKKTAVEEQRLNLRQKEDLIQKLQEQLGEAQRRIEQGSQERQGEMLEEELIDVLRQTFPFDHFEEVKRGARGADVMQTVHNLQGKTCGRILWESKNTKSFDKNWLTKLKKDQQESGAEISVLMTTTMPANMELFGNVDDVWVTEFKSALCLCSALRQTLILVEREKLVATHQDGLKDIIYQYITGQEFTARVKMIYTAYQGMLVDLETEKRSMLRIWKSREKRIALVLDNIAGMRGELEGIMGGQRVLPEFEPLSLEAIAAETADSEN